MPSGPIVALIVLLVGLPLLGGFLYVEWRRHHKSVARERRHEAERLPLFGTDMLASAVRDAAGDDAPQPRAVPRVNAHQPAPIRPIAASRLSPDEGARGATGGYPPIRRPEPDPSVGRPPVPLASPAWNGTAAGMRPAAAPLTAQANSALLDGETLRFAIPDEGTLQFLPGRLEVVAGLDTGREVRFVRPTGGADPVEITFGRSEGPAYRHVQLIARTVSRQHATMTLDDGHWSLRNLSATNPVVHNGRPLAENEIVPLLVDGDRIEMGEVTFLFHSR